MYMPEAGKHPNVKHVILLNPSKMIIIFVYSSAHMSFFVYNVSIYKPETGAISFQVLVNQGQRSAVIEYNVEILIFV